MYSEKQKRFQDWIESEEYKALCLSLDLEIENILQHGLTFLGNDVQSDIVRTEFGSKSDLHRGFYCPSPIKDICVGNVKRGKLLKRITSRSREYYTYGFDKDGHLVCAENIWDGKSVLERIYHTDTGVYGIILDQRGHIYTISYERWNNKLVSYTNVLFIHFDGIYDPLELTKEDYFYDSEGLCQCIRTFYQPSSNLCQQMLYQFVRKNGKFASYRAADIIGSGPYTISPDSHEYTVYIDRNA